MTLVIMTTAIGCTEAEPTPCDRAEEVIQMALDNYCADKGEQCWYCRCNNSGQVVEAKIIGDQTSYSCKNPESCQDDPATEEDECACRDNRLTEAEACLADPDECAAPSLAHALNACQGTPI